MRSAFPIAFVGVCLVSTPLLAQDCGLRTRGRCVFNMSGLAPGTTVERTVDSGVIASGIVPLSNSGSNSLGGVSVSSSLSGSAAYSLLEVQANAATSTSSTSPNGGISGVDTAPQTQFTDRLTFQKAGAPNGTPVQVRFTLIADGAVSRSLSFVASPLAGRVSLRATLDSGAFSNTIGIGLDTYALNPADVAMPASVSRVGTVFTGSSYNVNAGISVTLSFLNLSGGQAGQTGAVGRSRVQIEMLTPGATFTTCSGAAYTPCNADLNADGQVDDSDFQLFVVAYNILDCADLSMPAGCPADINRDAIVDDADFVIFGQAYDELLCP
ncbi:MAG: hypothetical protein JNK16_12840 [Phycisphaerales bacterium]|nr:hypothetical protein [Phycisphaerales bacterium]